MIDVPSTSRRSTANGLVGANPEEAIERTAREHDASVISEREQSGWRF
jgi:hypothetical protein